MLTLPKSSSFMISPLALHFYVGYGPVLRLLHASPATSWLTGFFLPHFSQTTSAVLNVLKPTGFVLASSGLIAFLVGAVQLYASTLLRRGAVTGGLYRFIRHPQYRALAVLGLGTVLIWPRFLVLASFVIMLCLYDLLARWEEARCLERLPSSPERCAPGLDRPKWSALSLGGTNEARLAVVYGRERVTTLRAPRGIDVADRRVRLLEGGPAAVFCGVGQRPPTDSAVTGRVDRIGTAGTCPVKSAGEVIRGTGEQVRAVGAGGFV